MIKRFGVARRGIGLGIRSVVSLLAFAIIAVLGVTLTVFAAPEERVDACEAYAVYEDAGSGDSGLAKGMQRVCERVGSVPLTQACLTYHTRLSDPAAPPDEAQKLDLAVACENSMPGGTVISGARDDAQDGSGEPMLLPQPAAVVSGWDTNPGCGAGLDCRTEPDDRAVEEASADTKVAQADIAGPAPAAAPETPATAADTENAADASTDTQASAAPRVILPGPYVAKPAETVTPEADAENAANATPEPEAEPQTAEPETRVEPVATDAEPAPETVAAQPEPEVPLSPEELYAAAQALLDEAYQRPVAEWNEAAAPAVAMLVEAGAAGWAPAYVELGGLAENGIGMAADRDMALAYYIEAGRMGAREGYFRALMLYDATGNDAQYVETFLMLYRVDPGMALDSLDAVGRNGPMALQRYLKDEGYYTGALDGAFGEGSRAALEGLVSGGPKPGIAEAPAQASATQAPTTQVAPPPPTMPADGLAVELQMALQRVGCYPGPVDGRWGPSSVDALAAFNRWRGTHFPVQMPSVQALAGVRRSNGPVCPIN